MRPHFAVLAGVALVAGACDRSQSPAPVAQAAVGARAPIVAPIAVTVDPEPAPETTNAQGGAATEQAPFELARARTLFSASRLKGGRVLVAGGLADQHQTTSFLPNAEVVDTLWHDGVGRVLPPIEFSARVLPGHFLHAAVELDDGRVLLIGGSANTFVEWFDPDRDAKGRFVRGPELPGGPRAALSATKLADGRVFIAGGRTVGGQALDATALFDPKANAIKVGPSLLRGRACHAATLLADGRVWLCGGVGVDSTEFYDPTTNTITAGPTLSCARDDHRATLLDDGTVLIAGGQDALSKTLRTAERFDPSSGRLDAVGSLSDARADHEQVLLGDGTVLVLGGESDDGTDEHDTILASVERFDPNTGRFTSCAPMREARDDFAAVKLGDGRLLLIGGQGRDGVLKSLEFYGP